MASNEGSCADCDFFYSMHCKGCGYEAEAEQLMEDQFKERLAACETESERRFTIALERLCTA